MHEIPACFPWFHPENSLDSQKVHFAKFSDIANLTHHVLHVLRWDTRKTSQEFLRSSIDSCTCLRIFFCPDGNGPRDVRFMAIRFEIVEDFCRGIRWRGPDDAHSGKCQCKKNDLGLESRPSRLCFWSARFLFGWIFACRFGIGLEIGYDLWREGLIPIMEPTN